MLKLKLFSFFSFRLIASTVKDDINDGNFDPRIQTHVTHYGFTGCSVADPTLHRDKLDYECYLKIPGENREFTAAVPVGGYLMHIEPEKIPKFVCNEDLENYPELPCWKRHLVRDYGDMGIWQFFSFEELGGLNEKPFYSSDMNERYSVLGRGKRWNVFHKMLKHVDDEADCVISLRGTRNQGEFMADDLPAFATCPLDPRDGWRSDEQKLLVELSDSERIFLNTGFMHSGDKYFDELALTLTKLSVEGNCKAYDVVGHSLGGALAPVVATMIKTDKTYADTIIINDVVSLAGPNYAKVGVEYRGPKQNSLIPNSYLNGCANVLRGDLQLDARNTCTNMKKLFKGKIYRYGRTELNAWTTDPDFINQGSDPVTRIPFVLALSDHAVVPNAVSILRSAIPYITDIPKSWIHSTGRDDSERWSTCSDYSYYVGSNKEGILEQSLWILQRARLDFPPNVAHFNDGQSRDAICEAIKIWLGVDHSSGYHDPMEYGIIGGSSILSSVLDILPRDSELKADYSYNKEMRDIALTSHSAPEVAVETQTSGICLSAECFIKYLCEQTGKHAEL